jgi:hypothetical protein
MLSYAPVSPCRTAVEVILKLGASADVIVDSDPEGYPILAIVTADINVLVMPYSASEGGAVTLEDLSKATEVLKAVEKYREELRSALQASNGIAGSP